MAGDHFLYVQSERFSTSPTPVFSVYFLRYFKLGNRHYLLESLHWFGWLLWSVLV